MKSLISSTNMATGPYVTRRSPGTLIKINDNTGREIPSVSTFGYSVLQAIYSPKGPTRKFICIEGDDVLQKYDKLFGKGNTNLWGPMATYARRALEAGFNLNVINVAPDDARHANVHVAFCIKQKRLGDQTTGPLQNLEIFAHLNPETNVYTFGKTREELPQDANEIKTITIPQIQMGFVSKFIEDVDSDYDPEKFLGEDDVRVAMPSSSQPADLDINIPVFGIFYEGATEYGNNYSLNISDTTVLLKDKYALYKATILDKTEKEFEFNFTLFNITQDNLSTSFRDTANSTCKMMFTKNNALQLFRPFMVSRKIANKAKKLVADACSLVTEDFITKVKTAYPGFDETTSESNIMELVGPTNEYALYYQTQNNEIGRTLETPFAVTTPWTIIDSSATLLEHTMVSRKLKFEGGSSGKLKDILDESEFDWNIKYTQSEEPVFERMFMDAYSGKTDKAIFDQALVKDSLLLGDSYPLKVQETIENLVRYKEDIIYNDKTRPDFTYWRTPHKEITDFNQVLNWIKSWEDIVPKGVNVRCKPFVGRAFFQDGTTGGQNKFELFYDYLGPNSSLAAWLNSGTSSPFASGSWSDITTNVAATEELIPDDDEREILSSNDVNYYRLKSDKTLALGEDTAMYLNHTSGLKNSCTTLHFNRILNIIALIARDNPIIDPTKSNVDDIVRKMKKAAAIPAKHFGNTLNIQPLISSHEMEVGRNVVVYDVSVECGDYSRHNRVVMNANLSSNKI